MAVSSPPPGLLPRSQDFDSLWYLSSQIGDGGQGQIYTTYPTKNNTKHYDRYQNIGKDSKYVTKIIQISPQSGARERIVNIYSFLQKSKLLNIYAIYHDQQQKRVLIVMEKLSHVLDEKYLHEHQSHYPFNVRFARPGYIYINIENSLKLFVKQIANQLHIIHFNQRIHFDLKPENVMFNANENKWCIIDYDLMKQIPSDNISKLNTTTNTMQLDHYRGTQSWTSPEMVYIDIFISFLQRERKVFGGYG